MYADSVRGRFITFEGIEGVGKSTQLELAAAGLRERGIAVVCTREPGGTPLAEKLRGLLLETGNGPMAVATELLLLFAARASHVADLIAPALTAGRWVLCDRFTDATRAYQGGGRGVPVAAIEQLAEIAHPGLAPDLTLLFDAPPAVALGRARTRPGRPDRFEEEDLAFFERVRVAYLELSARDPARIRRIDALPPVARVAESVAAELDALLAAVGP